MVGRTRAAKKLDRSLPDWDKFLVKTRGMRVPPQSPPKSDGVPSESLFRLESVEPYILAHGWTGCDGAYSHLASDHIVSVGGSGDWSMMHRGRPFDSGTGSLSLKRAIADHHEWWQSNTQSYKKIG